VRGVAVRYRFRLGDGSELTFTVDVGSEPGPPSETGPLPEWTALEYRKCQNCPLDPALHPRCPAATSIAALVDAFDGLFSYETVGLEVTTPERTVMHEKVPLQKALGSLMGLVLPMSGCPHTAFLRPMARFHLPLASVQETVFRASSTYLLGSWIRRNEGLPSDFDLTRLAGLYERVQVVNRQLHARLKGSTTSDSSANAVVLLDVLAQFLPMAVEESMATLKPLFSSYLSPEGP